MLVEAVGVLVVGRDVETEAVAVKATEEQKDSRVGGNNVWN